MRVRFLAIDAGPDGVRQPGTVHDVDDAEAAALIDGKYAEKADATPAKKPPAKKKPKASGGASEGSEGTDGDEAGDGDDEVSDETSTSTENTPS